MRRGIARSAAVLSGFLLVSGGVQAQERSVSAVSVTYAGASEVYINSGRDQLVVPGDTIRIVHAGQAIGDVEVTSVSKRSSACRILRQSTPFRVGDDAVLMRAARVAARDTTDVVRLNLQPERLTSVAPSGATPPEDVVTGWLSLQYNFISAEDSRLNLSQPASSLRLDVANLLGTGTRLSFNARSTYDAKAEYAMYGKRTGLDNRLYEISLQRDPADEAFGFGLGRLTSQYVGTMGSFDGFQATYRRGEWTAGVLGGAQVQDPTLSLDHAGTKGALFVNFRTEGDVFRRYDGTIAYGRQTLNGRLDRDFVSTQHALTLGRDWSLLGMSDVELGDFSGSGRTSTPVLSNALLLVNGRAADWLDVNADIDVTRGVYLFESMKAIPDSLFDRSIRRNLRAGATAHWTSSLTISLNASIGSRDGTPRGSHSIGGAIRMIDVFGSDMNAGIRYGTRTGEYVSGTDLAITLDRLVLRNLTATLRLGYALDAVDILRQQYKTRSAGVDLQYLVARDWSFSVFGQYINDDSMNSFRISGELGIHF